MQGILAGLEGVLCYMDDILLHTPNQAQHEELLEEVLDRLNEDGLKLNQIKLPAKKTRN